MHLARLRARDEVLRLAAARKFNEAMHLAARYQLETAVIGAVVLETKAQYERAVLKPVEAATVPVVLEPETWMLMLLAFATWSALRKNVEKQDARFWRGPEDHKQ